MPNAVVVVPCFNEEQRLDVEAFRAFVAPGAHVSFVFANDGSTDGTHDVVARLARDAPDKFAVVDLAKNGGKAEAVRRGMQAALAREPDYVGYWDADLSTPLDEIPRFLDVLERSREIELVYGARVMLMGRTIERFALRHYVGRIFATAASSTLSLPIYDTQCGAKMFRVTETIARVFAEPFISPWIFDVEIIARTMQLHPEGPAHVRRALYELPLKRWIDVKGSKVKPQDFGRALVDLYRIRSKYR